MNLIRNFLFLLLVALSVSCSHTIRGRLTEGRDYFNTGATGGDHAFVSFSAMKANLPVGILTDKGEFIYLAVPSEHLADFATKTIKVKGKHGLDGKVVKTKKIWVKTENGWQEVDF